MSKRWDEMDDMELLQLEGELRGELDDLRLAASAYADRAWVCTAGNQGATLERAAGRGWMAWAAVAGTAALLAVGAGRFVHPATPATTGETAAGAAVAGKGSSAISDEALLQQIQSDLSSGVPQAMEPLQASSDGGRVTRGVNR